MPPIKKSGRVTASDLLANAGMKITVAITHETTTT